MTFNILSGTASSDPLIIKYLMYHLLAPVSPDKRTVQKNYCGEIPNNFTKALYTSVYEKTNLHSELSGKTEKASSNLSFTEKQITIMRLVADGFSRNDIAEKLGIKPNTVKSHLDIIKQKLDVISLTDAIIKVKHLGILDEIDD